MTKFWHLLNFFYIYWSKEKIEYCASHGEFGQHSRGAGNSRNPGKIGGAPQTINLLASFTNVDMCSRSNVEIYNRKTFKKKVFQNWTNVNPTNSKQINVIRKLLQNCTTWMQSWTINVVEKFLMRFREWPVSLRELQVLTELPMRGVVIIFFLISIYIKKFQYMSKLGHYI